MTSKTQNAMTKTPQGLTLEQIMKRFGTDDAAREYLESVRWPNGPVCPHCGNCDATRIYTLAANPAKKIRAGLRECKECSKQFTVTVGTIFEDSHIPLGKWLVAWYLLCSSKKGISALQMQRMLELGSYRSAWFMMHRIRFALRDRVFTDKLGGGGKIVEADECFIGGKLKVHGRGRGSYTQNKAIVVSLVEREGQVRSRGVANVTGATLGQVLKDHVDPSTHLMTDQYKAYRKPGKKFAKHDAVNHSAGEYARGIAHTNTVEGYFSILKRGVDGIFHHVSKKYIDQYLAEFDFRYNTRAKLGFNDSDRTIAALKKASGKRLTYRQPAQI
jgi:transposase-like protein